MTEKQPSQQPYPENYPPYEDEINLIDYLRVLWKWKWFIIAGTVICAVAAMGITMVRYPAKHVTECTISLNFPGIEKHKNPDGTLFDKNQIITPAILSKAVAFLQKGNKALPLENIREIININAVILPEEKKGSYTVFPNQFSLALTLEQDDIFSIRERNQILLSIVDEYRKDFEKKYGEEPLVVIEFPVNFLADADYIDVINTFKVRTDNCIKFLDSTIAKAGFFRSQKTGDSFMDVKNDLELLNNIKISETEATIKTLKLTKNKDNLINVYRQRIRTIDVERKKKESEALIARKLLRDTKQSGRYESPKSTAGEKGGTSLVLDTSFIKDLVKEDSSALLLKTALQAEIKAKNLEVDKEFLEEEIALLNENEKEKEKEKENITYIQTGLKDIEGKIIALSKRANELNVEYLGRLVNNTVQTISDPETNATRSKSIKKIVLLSGVVALFMLIFLAFFIEYIKNTVQSTKQTR
ncbi:MAG: hypothetical protein Q7J15_09105 [Candidatus Desulfaltia sp.]|nr:hypothetical protein [Candidatus Desulfaltia sp.]